MKSKQLDAGVLGQMVLMQSILINLPNKKSIYSFVCKGLKDIPGVAYVKHLNNTLEIPEATENQINLSIDLGDSNYGCLQLTLSNKEKYNPYHNYLKNFVFMLGVILEERKQRLLNKENRQLLEQRIEERTQELKHEKDSLIESQRRFNDLMKNINLVSIMLDNNGDIIFCNKYFLALTGYTHEEVIGSNWFDTFLPKSDSEAIKIVFKDAIKGSSQSDNFENEICTKSGEKILISWNNTLLRDADKQIIGTASIGENITERKKAELALIERNNEYKKLNDEYASLNEELSESLENLQKLNTQLTLAKKKAEESDRLKTAFLQNMSHEIRTPMNAIMGFSDLLVDNFNNKTKLLSFSQIIKQRSSDLLEIINDILDIAKIESGQLPINLEACNLHELFNELTTFFKAYQSRINKNHIDFIVNNAVNKANATIITDRIKLKQILINLISNAFKFTDVGKIQVGCWIEENKKIHFTITDTGIGIPQDKQEVIFDRFAQLNQSVKQNIGGTGLGLSIVKGLVELLGGKVLIESDPNKGSTFSFTIPFKNKPNKENQETVYEASSQVSLVDKIVLVVEDDTYNAQYLMEILSNNGINALQVGFGKEAIKLSKTQMIDLVLMDIRLPDINGYEATRQIIQQNPQQKIIAQTAFASDDEKQKALNAGCIDFISKPTKEDALIAMLSMHLE